MFAELYIEALLADEALTDEVSALRLIADKSVWSNQIYHDLKY